MCGAVVLQNMVVITPSLLYFTLYCPVLSCRAVLCVSVSCIVPSALSTHAFLTPSVLGHIFIFILAIICRFHTAPETHVGIKIVQTLRVINLLTSIDTS